MAVDRGGLDYGIRTRADLRDLQRFISEVDSAKRSLRELRNVQRQTRLGGRARQDNLRAVRQEQQAQREILRTQRAELQVEREKLRVENQQIQNARARQRFLDGSVRSEQLLLRLKRQQRGEAERLAAAERRAAAAAARARRQTPEGRADAIQQRAQLRRSAAEVLEARGLTARGDPVQRRASNFQVLGRRILGAGQAANRASFSFRRLFGILAAFTIAREIANGFTTAVRSAVQFNAQIETIELGIASLLTSVGQIRNPFGETIEGAEALAAAQGLARDQTALLRRDALQTAATFEQLAETFQTALAPGLQAGLDVDQVRQFTVQISQAATAIGLQQNQLAEEIRSLLSGTITARTTRIATSLGITNEDIRRAREAGELFEFLQDRFAAFTEAGGLAAQTFTARIQNFVGALRQGLGRGTSGLFENLTATIADFQDRLVSFDEETGEAIFSPEFLEIVEAFDNRLQGALDTVVAFIDGLETDEVVDFLDQVGAALELAVSVGSGIAQGLITAASDLRAVFEGISDALQDLGITDTNTGIQELTATLTRFFALFTVASVVRLPQLLLAIAGGLRAVVAAQGAAAGGSLLGGLGGLLGAGGRGAAGRGVGGQLARVGPALRSLVSGIRGLLPVVARFAGALGSAVIGIQVLVETVRTERAKAESERRINETEQRSAAGRTLFDPRRQDQRINQLRREAFGSESERGGAARQGATAADILVNDPRGLARLNDEFGVSRDLVRDIAAELDRAANRSLDSALSTTQRLNEQFREIDRRDVIQGLRDFAEGPGFSVSGPVDLDSQVRALDSLRASLREVNDELRVALVDLGQAEGSSLFLDQQLDVRRDLFGIVNAQLEAEREIAGLQEVADRARLRARATGVDQEVDAVLGARRSGTPGVAAAVGETLSDEDSERVLAIAQDIAQAEERILVLKAQNEERTKAIAQAEEEAFRVAVQRARVESEAAAQAQIRENRALVAQVQAGQIRRGAAGGNQTAQSIADQRARLVLLQQERQEIEATTEARIRELRARRAVFVEQSRAQGGLEGEDLAAARANQRELNALTQERGILLQQNNQRQAEVQERLEALRLAAEQPLELGMATALVQLEQQFDAFQETIEITRNAVNSFADLASNAIVDAFDPTKKVDIKERFARFLQDIARQIIQTFIRIAIVRATLNLFSGGTLGAAGAIAGAAGAWQGGLVGSHGMAKGYAEGGTIAATGRARPPGLHPSDTVPIWAAPGEFMVRRKAVSSYGADTIAAINQGLVDPTSLKALASTRSTRARRPRSPGFAEGGMVTPAAGAQGSIGFSRGRPVPVPVVFTQNNAQAETFVSQSSAEFGRGLKRNRKEMNANLGGRG